MTVETAILSARTPLTIHSHIGEPPNDGDQRARDEHWNPCEPLFRALRCNREFGGRSHIWGSEAQVTACCATDLTERYAPSAATSIAISVSQFVGSVSSGGPTR